MVVALVEMKEMEVVKARVWLLVKRSERKGLKRKRNVYIGFGFYEGDANK